MLQEVYPEHRRMVGKSVVEIEEAIERVRIVALKRSDESRRS
jgi:hypothetical protein